jgi:ribosomal protein L10
MFILKSETKKITKKGNYVEIAKNNLIRSIFGKKLDAYAKNIVKENCLVQFVPDDEEKIAYVYVIIQYNTSKKQIFHNGKVITYKN